MIRIGITGGMGCGKSFVAERLMEKGYPVFNCDQEAKFIITHHPDVRRKLMDAVGNDLYVKGYNNDGKTEWMINKSVMAKFLFKSKKNNRIVNSIVHPQVATAFQEWSLSENVREAPLIFMESAILFESGFNRLVDKTVLVIADDSIRLERVAARDGLTTCQINDRLKFQTPQQELIPKADFIIDNNPNTQLNQQIDTLLQKLINE